MDHKQNPMDAAEAARALASITETRHEVAGRVGSPPHYYTKLGVAMALLCLAQAFDTGVRLAISLAALGVLFWATRSYAHRTGTWTMATLREKGAWMAWLMIAVMIAALGAAMVARELAVSLVCGAVVLALVSTLGPRWDAAWVRSLTERDERGASAA